MRTKKSDELLTRSAKDDLEKMRLIRLFMNTQVQELLDMQKEAHGEECAQSAKILRQKAVLLEKKGELQGALEAHEEAIKVWRANGNGEGRDVAQCLHDCGLLLLRQGLFKTALERSKESLRIANRAYEPGHPSVMATKRLIDMIASVPKSMA